MPHDQAKRAQISVCGLGYIGLPTASLFAARGFCVTGVDVVPAVVDTINRGEIHIEEPYLDVLVRSVVQSGQLKASLTPVGADVFIIAVPTPFVGDHQPELKYVEAATRALAAVLKPGDLVILESTSPVGTTELVAQWIAQTRPDLRVPAAGATLPAACAERIYVAHCPERVLPGKILKELAENERIIGGVDRVSAERARDLYAHVVTGAIHLTDARTAEMCKLVENSSRDVAIAFANELSMLCAELDVNVWELIKLANCHPRVNILQPGPGVGGHCIAVDPWFLISACPEQARLIRAAREVNHAKPQWVLARIREQAAGFRNPVIACLGLAFKPNVDDLRESPAVEIVRQLAREQAGRLLAVEPFVAELPAELAEAGVCLCDFTAAVKAADIVVMLVDHDAFKRAERAQLAGKVLIDTRGVWQ